VGFFEKRTETCFFSKKNKKPEFEKTGGLEFFEINGFFSTLIVRSGTTYVIISLIGRAPYT